MSTEHSILILVQGRYGSPRGGVVSICAPLHRHRHRCSGAAYPEEHRTKPTAPTDISQVEGSSPTTQRHRVQRDCRRSGLGRDTRRDTYPETKARAGRSSRPRPCGRLHLPPVAHTTLAVYDRPPRGARPDRSASGGGTTRRRRGERVLTRLAGTIAGRRVGDMEHRRTRGRPVRCLGGVEMRPLRNLDRMCATCPNITSS